MADDEIQDDYFTRKFDENYLAQWKGLERAAFDGMQSGVNMIVEGVKKKGEKGSRRRIREGIRILRMGRPRDVLKLRAFTETFGHRKKN